MYFTQIDAIIYSLAIGLGVVATVNLSAGPTVGILAGVVTFAISFSLFELISGRRK